MIVITFEGAKWTCNGCGKEVEAQGHFNAWILPKEWIYVNYQKSEKPDHQEVFHFCSKGCLTKWAMADVVVTDEYGREFTWDGSMFVVEKKEEVPF